MCSNYHPIGHKELSFFDVPPIDDDIPTGDVYPGGGAPLIYRSVNADLKLTRFSGGCRFKTDTPLSH